MLYADRFDSSEGIDVNKTGFKFQPDVCNRCHNLLMMYMNLSDIAILKINSD